MRRRTTILLVTVIGLLGAAVLVWRMINLAPQWWRPPDPAESAVQKLADRVEWEVTAQAHRMRRTNKPWAVRVRDEQINAWLATRLPAWLKHGQKLNWPAELGTVQAHLEPDRILIGVELHRDEESRIALAAVRPSLTDGMLRVKLVDLGLGRMLVPGESVVNLSERLKRFIPADIQDDPEVARLVDLLLGQRSIEPIFVLGDGRRIRLLDYQLSESELVLQFETAHRAAK